jgi:hypothetical protein
MAAGRPRGPNDPSLISSLEVAVRKVRRPGPAELAWNWRWELGILAALAGTCWLIASDFGLSGLAAVTGAGLAAGAALLYLPPARRWLTARAWCLLTPHRIRRGCVNAWVQTRNGRLPVVLSARPAPYGERVRLWLRAGLTAGDLHAASEVLAAACWAMEVRVVRSARYAHLVTLEIVRNRDQERARLTLQAAPDPLRGADEDLADAEEPDTSRWPGIPV